MTKKKTNPKLLKPPIYYFTLIIDTKHPSIQYIRDPSLRSGWHQKIQKTVNHT